MTVIKNEKQTTSLTVTEGLTVTILPSLNHEYLMDVRQVAYGYGISYSCLRSHINNHQDEILKGKHFVIGVQNMDSKLKMPHNKVFLTKRGIVRLGFFVKSERAKLFRDWAEELVLEKLQTPKQQSLFDAPVKQLPSRRNHNRLTSDRLLSIMADICRIDDKALRLSLSTKLMQEGIYDHI